MNECKAEVLRSPCRWPSLLSPPRPSPRSWRLPGGIYYWIVDFDCSQVKEWGGRGSSLAAPGSVTLCWPRAGCLLWVTESSGECHTSFAPDFLIMHRKPLRMLPVWTREWWGRRQGWNHFEYESNIVVLKSLNEPIFRLSQNIEEFASPKKSR